MATSLHDLGNGTYALLGGSNLGLVIHERKALLVDTGLDKDTARKAFRAVEEKGARPVAALITHAHADHFGGAAWLAERGLPIYAPPLEAAFVTYPILEPLFLYGGAAPIAELRGKFTLAPPAPVAGLLRPGSQHYDGLQVEIVPLPGHAPEQVGIASGATLYCGDAIFPPETLERHPILFCADLDAALETLARLPTLGYTRTVPGHGEPLADPGPLAAANAARLREIRARVWETLATPQEPPALLRAVAATYGETFPAPQFYLLALTTIHAALTSLQRAGEAEICLEANHFLWRRK